MIAGSVKPSGAWNTVKRSCTVWSQRSASTSMLGLPMRCCVRGVPFFFSSRRRHTRYWRDWSSDVCSSDLARVEVDRAIALERAEAGELAVDGKADELHGSWPPDRSSGQL